MTSRLACITGAVVLTASTASAQTAGARPQVTASIASRPMITVGLFEMRDGKSKASAGDTGEYPLAEIGSTVYIAPCGTLGAANTGYQITAFATDVWVVSGKVLELNDQYASVQLGWRRTRRNGQDESSPEQSSTLTLKRGERHTLENVSIPATGSCDARSVSFDVVFGSRFELYGISDAHNLRGGGTSSSGVRSGSVQGSMTRVDGAGGGGGVSIRNNQLVTTGPDRLSAELWLVRSRPGQADEIANVTSRLTPMPVSYSFAPMALQSVSGLVTVKVDGTVEVGLSPDGERRFHFTASRTVTSSTSSRPAEAKPVVEGSTKTTVAFPGPDEVLSFEMPPLRTADGVTLPDRFSIRVRVGSSPAR